MTTLILTTNPGLEDIVAAELQSRLHSARMVNAVTEKEPFGLAGQLQARFDNASDASFDTVWALVRQMRSVHHVHRPLHFFTLSPDNQLQQIIEEVRALDIPEMEAAETFRVTSKRSGTHTFSSVDVQRGVGAALVDNYGTRVNLTEYDVNLRVDLFEQRCYIALQLTHKPLDQRHNFVYRPKVAMKANVAYALLVLAGLNPLADLASDTGASNAKEIDEEIDEPITLLDPFCGSGTMLLEAADCFPTAKLYASDRYERPIEWTGDNLEAAGLSDRVALHQADARDLASVFPAESIGYIVTNPPFGKGLGPHTNFLGLYTHFLRAAHQVLKPKGRIAMLVWRRNVFTRVAKEVGFRILHVRIVDTGGLFPGVFVLEKKR